MKREGGAEYRTSDTLKDRHHRLTGALIGVPAGLAAKGNRPTLPKVPAAALRASGSGCQDVAAGRKQEVIPLKLFLLCPFAVSLGVGASQSADSLACSDERYLWLAPLVVFPDGRRSCVT